MGNERTDQSNTQKPAEQRRVALCITELDPGGAERNLVRLATGLHERGWDVRVFCLAGETPFCAQLRQAGVAVECLGAGGPWNFWVVFRLARKLTEFQPTVCQTFLFHANLAGRLAAWWAGIPHVLSGVRVAEKDAPFRLWLDRITQRFVTLNVCVSRGVERFCTEQAGLPPTKCLTIPNGVDLDELAKVSPLPLKQFGADSPTVLFVGRLAPQKAPEVLLDAVPLVLERFPDVHFLLVGDGPLKPLLQQRLATLEEPFKEKVHLVGRQPNAVAFLKSAACLVLPSRWEGIPNVVLEAMAVGTPVVATRVEGVEELLGNNERGLLVPLDSPTQLAEAICRLLADPQTAARLAEAAKTWVSKELTVKNMVDAYERLYLSLLTASA